MLNIWRPRDSEIEAFAWDVQVGMRSTILDDSKEDRARFNQLSRMLTYSLPISAQDFWKSTTSMPMHFANRSPD